MALRVSVVVQAPEQLEGENDAMTPAGRPEAENEGLALPLTVAVTVVVPAEPCKMETELGFVDRLMLLAGVLVPWYS